MQPKFCFLILLALFAYCPPTTAYTTSLSVAPTRVELSSNARSGSVNLDNTGETETTVQVETFAWTGNNSIEALEPTRGLLAVPAVFNLPAGGRQVIRVASREGDPSEVEAAYRMVISEVPLGAPTTAAGIRFALRLSLPVFITPPGAAPSPVWSRSADGRGLNVQNEGNAHLHVRQLRVTEEASGRLLAEVTSPSYVLARSAHHWPDLVKPVVGSVVIEAQTNVGDLNIVLER
jgi:fimbrial chaperone protein